MLAFDVVDAQGTLAVGCTGEQTFSPAQRQLFRTFTSITALSLARTAALDLYRSIAETLQEALVPDPQVAGDLVVRRKIIVADGATIAGGDWYDGYALPSGRQALVIGDVVGHGAQAAGRSAIFRHSLRTLLLTGCRPGESLVQLEELVRSHPDRPAGTLLLAEICAERREAQLFVSAHPPPVLISPTGEVRIVRVDPVPPLGSGLVVTEPTPTVVDLSNGAILVFITDGVVELRSESLDRSYQRLCTALTGATTVDQAMSAIENMIDQRVLRDDALFVASAIAPPGAR